jgi:hypothetical protein
MNKKEILVVGRNEERLQAALSILRDNKLWKAFGVMSGEEAIEKFHQYTFDVVVLLHEIGDEEARKLRKLFLHQSPDIVLVHHHDTSVLPEEIGDALDRHHRENKRRVLFTDDAFKNAGLNITLQ